MIKVFYGDCVLLFCRPEYILPEGVTTIPAEGIAKIIENLEKYKQAAVVADDPDHACVMFMDNFRHVDAAGGIVENSAGELLMIHRNGRWDLPKGHREEGEDFATCALREVEEETGVHAAHTGKEPVIITFHFYRNRGVWEMKRTEWYRMEACGGTPAPQTVEGIEIVEWIPRDDVRLNALSCFPSVREVLKEGGWL